MNFDDIFFEISDYKLTNHLLGEGTYGKVYIVKNNKENKDYAVKILRIIPEIGFTSENQKIFLRESTILQKLDHKSIVKFIGINFQSFSDPLRLEPSIITGYLPNGSLKEVLDKEKQSLAAHDWTSTKKFICLLGIVDAMRYLHEQNIVHRDLKPQNILMDENYYPRICDFGLSRCFPDSIKTILTGEIGSPAYMAPEIFDEKHIHYGKEIDVYAFAILAYEIVSGKEPYYEIKDEIKSIFNLLKKVSSGYRPKIINEIPDKMRFIINQCWDKNPQKRPSFETIFTKLTEDFSILGEDVDEDEVNDYIYKLTGAKIIQKKVRINPKMYSKKDDVNSKLHEACKYGHIDVVNHLLSLEEIDINSVCVLIFILCKIFFANDY